jgi:Family of unknown function (DUF6157)
VVEPEVEREELMNYYDTLVEVADDCPVSAAQVPQARGGNKTKAVVEYELLVRHPYTYTEEDIAFEVYAVLHDIANAKWATEHNKFLSKGTRTSGCRRWQNATAGAFITTPKASSP